MPPVNLGLHFPGIGFLPRLKLRPQVARKMLLEAHRWTGKEALQDGIVDQVAEPKEMLDVALTKARAVQGKAKMGVYSLLRNELWARRRRRLGDLLCAWAADDGTSKGEDLAVDPCWSSTGDSFNQSIYASINPSVRAWILLHTICVIYQLRRQLV